jgi:hypothetical protein
MVLLLSKRGENGRCKDEATVVNAGTRLAESLRKRRSQMFNIKYAKALLWVAFGLLVAGAIVFATGKNAIAPVVMATGIVGYLIYVIGKSGLPGAEPKEEQLQKDIPVEEHRQRTKDAYRERVPTHP